MSLTDINIPIVRCYSFRVFYCQNSKKAFNILINHLHDSEYVKILEGCLDRKSKVGDVFIEVYFWNRSKEGFDSTNFKIIDSLIFYAPTINLNFEYTLFKKQPFLIKVNNLLFSKK